jgi:hypothetical protein
MLNLIEVRDENNMTLTPTMIFDKLSNQDLIDIADAGELNSFCNALTLDLANKNEKGTTYEA